ncbi:hypothetical protein CDL15_Pgr027182 [Punica granatum]|uniref:Uncharacterized protein n=1 Tax=Punica granatum TaxID=22663 RepID=A0A218XAM4_PUNGR|nr:hypothetical protein CDL15_Pgr027182 [Punica granatum]
MSSVILVFMLAANCITIPSSAAKRTGSTTLDDAYAGEGKCVGRAPKYAVDVGDDITRVSSGRDCAGIGGASCSEITGCCSSAILPRARVGYRCDASC